MTTKWLYGNPTDIPKMMRTNLTLSLIIAKVMRNEDRVMLHHFSQDSKINITGAGDDGQTPVRGGGNKCSGRNNHSPT